MDRPAGCAHSGARRGDGVAHAEGAAGLEWTAPPHFHAFRHVVEGGPVYLRDCSSSQMALAPVHATDTPS